VPFGKGLSGDKRGREMNFRSLFNPSRTAVFGSVRENKIAHQIFTQMIRGGYSGKLYSINPGAMNPVGMEEISAFSDVSAVPGEIDLAVLAVPVRYAVKTLAACGEKGIPFAVVLTSGFSEVGNAEIEQKLAATALRYGIRIIGPNCAGIMSSHSKLFASIEERSLPGKTALISQSGAVGAAVLMMAAMRGIGFSHFVSFGNRIDIDESELLDYFLEDDNTEIAALYLESVRNGRRFLDSVSRFTAKKPLILIKSGKSQAGMRAASSHTGSMAGSDDVFDAVCRQTGVIRVAGLEEMLDLCIGFDHYPVPKGKKLLIITNSGGPGILTSDFAEEAGLEVASPSEMLKSNLKGTLLPNVSLNNPIDLTVEGTDKDYLLAISKGLEKEYDAAIAINVGTPFLDSLGLAEGIIKGSDLVPAKPVIPVFMSGEVVKSGSDFLFSGGSPDFPTGERAAAVLSAMASWYLKKNREQRQWSLLSESTKTKRGSFLEPDQVKFLVDYGFSFPAHSFATTEKEILHASKSLTFPMVMKVVSPNIIHKSEFGGVILNILNYKELLSAFRDMKNRLSSYDVKGVMVYEQVPDGTEIILGSKRDPNFGPVILVGAGGIMSEVMKDVSLRVAPVTEKECAEMLKELKYNKIISGFRGKPPLARGALIDLIMKLSELMTAEPWIGELDFNPVFLYENSAVIGDVRIIAGNNLE